MNSFDPEAVDRSTAIRIRDTLILLVVFILGVAAGADWARTECIKAKCAVPCGFTQVKIDRSADDWRDWSCRCTLEAP